jgi:galactitol-specific phosphotransferase system IIB component
MTDYFTKDSDGKFVEVSEKILPQSEVDGIIEKRLERERGKYADYDTLKETAGKVETIKSEYETKLKEKDTKIGELSTEVTTAKLGVTKVKIASEFKLSDEAQEFLTGDSEEKLREQAEKLSKVGGGKKVVVTKHGKPSGNDDKKSGDSKSIARNLFGRNSSDA